MTLSFWTYFSEALLDADFFADTNGAGRTIAKDVYLGLVGVLRRKCVWPRQDILDGWSKGDLRCDVP